ncbi:MAG: shikimate kinase [Gemmatimonadales bacterium]
MKQHIVLIGLPGAGKTTVGRIAAEQLHAGFVDIDTVLIRKEGKPIAMIFAEKGEPAFRAMERTAVENALANQPAVVVPGGGWAAQPGALETAKAAAYIIYLVARPETATARAVPSGTRPVLMGGDSEGQMRELLKAREPFYTQAHTTLQTEGRNPNEVAVDVVRLAQTSAGW